MSIHERYCTYNSTVPNEIHMALCVFTSGQTRPRVCRVKVHDDNGHAG
jgi:hypothetical protein